VIPPDLSTTIFFLTRFATFVVNSSFCVSAETRETFKTGDLAETSHCCRRLASPSPKWISRFQPDSVFQRSTNYRCLHVTVVAGGQTTLEFILVSVQLMSPVSVNSRYSMHCGVVIWCNLIVYLVC